MNEQTLTFTCQGLNLYVQKKDRREKREEKLITVAMSYMNREWQHRKKNESELKVAQRVQLFATLWTVQSMEFSRPEYWSG